MHKDIALLLCQEIEKDPMNAKCNIVFSEAILMLDIFTNDPDFLESMLEMCEDLVVVCIFVVCYIF